MNSRTDELTFEGRSFTYTKNRRGPSTVLWGTLDVTAAGEDDFNQGQLAGSYQRGSSSSMTGS